MAMKNIIDYLQTMGLHDKIFDSVLALLFFFLLRFILIRLFLRFPHEKHREYLWRKGATYSSSAVLLLLLAVVWLRGFNSLTTYFGLLSAGLAVALKDPLSNLAGWLFIIAKKPFQAGDRIQIGQYAGDVIDIDVFQFTLMESGTSGVYKDMRTGRLVKISNSAVFMEPQVNFTKGWFEFIWNTIEIPITFESNWKKARSILEEVVAAEAEERDKKAQDCIREASEKYMVLDMDLKPRVYTGVNENGVTLTAVYLCDPLHRRTSSGNVWEQILERFSTEDDITFAYPTQRSFSNIAEGKSGVVPLGQTVVQKRKSSAKASQQGGSPLFGPPGP